MENIYGDVSPINIQGEVRVLKVTVFLMIVFAALQLTLPLRLLGLFPTLPNILLIAYRAMDVVIVTCFFIFCKPTLKVTKIDFAMLIFISYPILIGLSKNFNPITFANDLSIYILFTIKVIIFRTTFARISANASIDAVFSPLAKKFTKWSIFIAICSLLFVTFLWSSGAEFYYQAPVELTLAAAIALAQGNITLYIFTIVLSLAAGKRMVMLGIIIMAPLFFLMRNLTPKAALQGVLAVSVVTVVITFFGSLLLHSEYPFAIRIKSTLDQILFALEASDTWIDTLMHLEPARFAEYISLQPYLTDWALYFGNGYGFRYELDHEFISKFYEEGIEGDVSNAHFTPLGIVSKFGLLGLFIWLMFIRKVFITKQDTSSFTQTSGKLAFYSMAVQSLFAYEFFISFFTPFYFAAATLRTQKQADHTPEMKKSMQTQKDAR